MTLEIPRHIDDPPQLLLWRVDDLLPLLVALIVGVLTDHLLVLLVLLAVGIVGVRLYGRYRENRPDGFVAHALYWAGLLPLAARSCPNPCERRFLP